MSLLAAEGQKALSVNSETVVTKELAEQADDISLGNRCDQRGN